MMATDQPLRISLPARPESVRAARGEVARFAVELGMEEPELGDLRTVVSEAAANVVRHAYPDGGGSFQVEAEDRGGELAVVVRDSGQGLQPQVVAESDSFRLGLGLIARLSRHFEIGDAAGGGTEVRIQMPLR
jgi:anti-sigma regulatory factor (Ser/Thr protein kinase)